MPYVNDSITGGIVPEPPRKNEPSNKGNGGGCRKRPSFSFSLPSAGSCVAVLVVLVIVVVALFCGYASIAGRHYLNSAGTTLYTVFVALAISLSAIGIIICVFDGEMIFISLIACGVILGCGIYGCVKLSDFKDGPCNYIVNENGTVTFSPDTEFYSEFGAEDYTNYVGYTYTISSEYDGKPVTAIKMNDYIKVKKLFVPSTVTRIYQMPTSIQEIEFEEGSQLKVIDEKAFEKCASLQSITIPNGVTEIGIDAFSSCTGLMSVTIPKSVTKIGGGAFYRCYRLKSVTIPESVTEIGSAFYDCASLTTVNWNATAATSAGRVFYCSRKYKTKLKTINISGNVKKLPKNVFYGCSALSDINYNGTKAQWNAITKGSDWASDYEFTIHCSDGIIEIVYIDEEDE